MRVAAQVTTVRTPKPAAKPASRSRLAFLRGRSWKFYAALAVGLPFLVFTLVVGYYYVVFSRMIDARMHGEFQRTDLSFFQFCPAVLFIGFYGRVFFRHGQLKAYIGINVAVGNVMHYLPDGPSAFTVWSVQLAIG